MSLGDLLLLYLLVGAACAVAVYRRSTGGAPGLASAVITVPFWPLWAPVTLTGRSARRGEGPRATTPAARRIRAALREGVEACAGTPLEALLSEVSEEQILTDVDRVEARRAELAGILQRPGFDLEAAEGRLRSLEEKGAPPRVLATSRLHVENVRRLVALQARDGTALEELAGLVEALRTQLVLARYAGSSVEGVGGIVSEVWERVESLGAAMEEVDRGGGEGESIGDVELLRER